MQYIIVLLAKQFGRIVQPEILEFHRFLLITKQLSAYGCQLIRDQYALEFISIAAFHVKIRVNPDQFSDLNVQTGFSLTSRTAAICGVSPNSIVPPGKPH